MFDPLPIDAILPQLTAALREQTSIVLRAPTGAGKTTRVPVALLDAKLTAGRIVVLEPRRLAARAAARSVTPTITSEGRLHPVEIVYEARSLQQSWPVAAARALERILPRTPGDVLCFLPGMHEIRQTARALGRLGDRLLVLPLHGDLS